MTDLPDVKLKAMPSLPLSLVGGVGIEANRENGAVTVDIAFHEFPVLSAVPASPTNNVLTYDTATDQYVMVPSSLLGGAVAGISDAPIDGIQYARQSGGWTPTALPATATPSIESGSGAVGSSTKYAREDHVHPANTLPATAVPLADSGAGAVGGSTKYAREDHVHPASGSSSFTQNGTGAVAVTYDSMFRGNIVTPEQFGAVHNGTTDDAAAIQRAINYIASIPNGGTVKFAPARYRITTALVISVGGITLQGSQQSFSRGTEIYYDNSSAGGGAPAISCSAGASVLSNVAIEKLSIRKATSALYHTGIIASDVSVFTLRDVSINGFTGGFFAPITGAVASPSGEIRLTVTGAAASWIDGWAVAVSGVVGTVEANTGWPIVVASGNQIDLKGSVFTNAYVSGGTITTSSTGIQLKGRELISIENVLVAADLPLRISKNPNNVNNSLDETTFFNTTFAIALGTNPIVMVDDGCVLSSVHFLGTQSWGGGKDGFVWRDRTAAAISQQLRFDNVRMEQKAVAGGTSFIIRPNNTLYSLMFVSPMFSDRDGIHARKTANLQIDNPHFLGTGKTLDIDATVTLTQINGSYCIAGSTASIVGQTIRAGGFVLPSGGALPIFVVYSV